MQTLLRSELFFMIVDAEVFLFFLLSFLASKVEAISCIIMSEGICIYIQAEVGTSV